MTRLCVSILVNDLAQARRDAATAAEAGADLVEYRIDLLTDPADVRRLVEKSVLPCILTCRPLWEGGQSALPEPQRIALLHGGCVGQTRYIDLELKTIRQTTGFPATCPIIASTHDFAGRPDRLHNLVTQLNDSLGTVNKIAFAARSIRDNLDVFEILTQRQKPTIALCMGEAGLISRVLARKFDAFLTFASLSPAGATASGQIPIADMKRLYRWDSIGPDTRVYGVVAQPVMHSMSPAIHNAAFDAVSHDAVYLPMLVEGSYESFKAFMETFLAFEPLALSGLSVTIPHKENALRYLREKNADIEPLAASIGAVNTIVIQRDGGLALAGLNTDYAAILDSITAALNIDRDALADMRVAIIGAGGTGRTAVAALAACGAQVTVYNRTLQRALALAHEFSSPAGPVQARPLDHLADSRADIYINTTSLGMHPHVQQWPLGDRPPEFSDQTLVFDTIYNPMTTRLLAHARQQGARTIGGIEMFVRQAARQFEAWTAQPAPVAVMRQVVEKRLASV